MAPAERLDVAGHFWRWQSAPNQALHLTAAAHAGSGPLGKFNEQCGQSGLERTSFGHG